MGQARWRKGNDPLYGRVPKAGQHKGLIISPPTEIQGSTINIVRADLDPQEIRFSLLFWEKLIWPSSRAIYIEGGPDSKFLEAERILSRPDYTFDGDVATGMKVGFLQALKDMNEKEPGVWSLASGERSLMLRDHDFSETGGSLVTLCRAIPIPQQDVPLEDILRFKDERATELLVVRHHLDSLLTRISDAENQQEEIKLCVREIESACADLVRVGREWQIPFYLGDIQASFSIDPVRMIEGAAAAVGAGKLFGTGLEIGVLGAIGAAASTIKIENSIKFRSMKAPKSPFRYAYLAHAELI